jgi:dihydrofolate reductase
MTAAPDRPRTQYFVAASIDGFIATEDDDLDWLTELDADPPSESDAPNPYAAFIGQVGAIAMGATTYDWVLEHDPGPWGFDQPTWVLTHRDLPVREGGGPLTFTDAPVPQVHQDLVAAAGDRIVWLVGGGELVGSFLDHDLLDELHLSVAPVLLGSGKPLLPRRRTRPMRLLPSSTFGGGTFAHLQYSLR